MICSTDLKSGTSKASQQIVTESDPELRPQPSFNVSELAYDAMHAMDHRLRKKDDQVSVSKDFFNEVTNALSGRPKTSREIVKDILPPDVLAKIKKYMQRKKKENPRIRPEELARRAAAKFNIELT